MITAILSVAVVWCLFYEKICLPVLALLCAGLGTALAFAGRHRHLQLFAIDAVAQNSRLKKVNPSLKFWSMLVLMAICISSRSPAAGIFLTVAVLILVVFIGGLKLRNYVHMMTLPVSFLMIGGLALLFDITANDTGTLNIQLFGIRLCVTESSQNLAAVVIARALGAVSCLYLLSLTTPMPDLIGVLRRTRCPDIIIELMYLIYRYIFIMLSMYHTMRSSAKSRLGYADYRISIRTTGNLYSNLISRSYRQANINFDAMESRCYDTEIQFLENTVRITGVQIAVSIGIAVCVLCLSLIDVF